MIQQYEGNRSYRKFLPKEIEMEKLQTILEALRLAHCGNNRQLLRYLVVTSQEKKDAVAQLVHYAASLPKEIGTPKKDEKAAAYFVILKPENSGPIQDVDTGIAAERITDCAWQMGIGSCMIMNFNVNEITEVLEVPSGYVPRLIVALGYPKIQSIVECASDGNLTYWVDENGDYHVPKLSIDEIAIIQ